MQQTKLLHYRNGSYQGQIKSNKRNGKGIMITDDGSIIVGIWKNDKLYGNALTFINGQQYSYGEFNRGQLQGWSKFQTSDKLLISQFNSNHTIGKQLLINKVDMSYKIIIPTRNGIYQTIKQNTLSTSSTSSTILQQLIQAQLNIKLPSQHFINQSYGLCQFIEEYYQNDDIFEIQTLINGYLMFKIKDQSSVVGLGFVINRNNQLISYGNYINSKLTGYGCKIQNAIRYQGIFLNGFLNGEGLKFNGGKYSFGTFENGTLINPIYLEQRSLASEQKLKQLKKLNHITNLNFANVYLPQNLLKFKGTREIIFEISMKQQFLFSQSAQKTTSPKKHNNLATKLLNKEQIQTKSNISISNRKINKNPEEDESRVIEITKSVSGMNSLRRFKM